MIHVSKWVRFAMSGSFEAITGPACGRSRVDRKYVYSGHARYGLSLSCRHEVSKGTRGYASTTKTLRERGRELLST
jgi:hypothetical protein